MQTLYISIVGSAALSAETHRIRSLRMPALPSAACSMASGDKMWGNGEVLPNVYFVLSGIVYYAQFTDFLL